MFLRDEALWPDSCPRPASVSHRNAHSSVGMAPNGATVWTNKIASAYFTNFSSTPAIRLRPVGPTRVIRLNTLFISSKNRTISSKRFS